jgi:cytidylate kinase
MARAHCDRWTLRQEWHPSVFLHTRPVVTISHESEDQGIALGQSVAERLGFGYWDRDLVMELAGLLNEKTATSMMLEESTCAAIEKFLGTSVPSQEAVSADYADLVRRIFNSITHRGGAVIVGRGAQFLVSPRESLRVRLVAPYDVRARKLETREGITFEEAQRTIEVGDHETASFVLHSMGHDVADPAYFDLIVNTDSSPCGPAVSLVLTAYFAKFGHWPSTARGLISGRSPGLAPALTPMRP